MNDQQQIQTVKKEIVKKETGISLIGIKKSRMDNLLAKCEALEAEILEFSRKLNV